MDGERATEQLAALADVAGCFARERIEAWLFGGWAVDFHAAAVTRPHEDIDLAVWHRDLDRIGALLEGDGWTRAGAAGDEDGFTAFVRGPVRLELAFLAKDERGVIYTPLRAGRASWPPDAFGDDVHELGGARVRVISRRALEAEKAEQREDPDVAAKDRLDLATLSRLR